MSCALVSPSSISFTTLPAIGSFTTAARNPVSEAMIVSLEEMVRHDPTIAELSNLPHGCVSRTASGEPWIREPYQSDDTDDESNKVA